MIEDEVVYVESKVFQPMFIFLRFCLLGCFHLNKLVESKVEPQNIIETNPRKRKRIIQRMARGYTGQKKRRFTSSKLKEALPGMNSILLKEQMSVLVAQEIVEKRTNKSFSLILQLSSEAQNFLQVECVFDGNEIMDLQHELLDLKED